MDWIPYELEKWHNQPLPPVGKWVLVHITERQTPNGRVPSTAVAGKLRYAAGDEHSPCFTTPGISGPIAGWSDCLPEDYSHPTTNVAFMRGE